MRRELDILEHRDRLLAIPITTHQDVRLMSQVSLVFVMSQIRDTFSSEGTQPLPKPLKVHFANFGQVLDSWFSRFADMFGTVAANALDEILN